MNKKIQKYDLLFILNTPSFYKVNLLNKLNEKCKVYAIFVGYTKVAILSDLKAKASFNYVQLYDYDWENVNTIGSFIRICKLLTQIEFEYLITSWDRWDMALPVIIVPTRKNGFILESSEYESGKTGIKALIKKMFLHFISTAFVSGIPHANLLKKLGYKGEIKNVGGVGVYPKPSREKGKKEHIPLRYIYTGRLIDVKNLELLVEAFNRNRKILAIVGEGELGSVLKTKANDNISFLGKVDNRHLKDLYKEYDCFILPSKSETWGLVVEEALYFGLPVIVSDMVGSNIDMVKQYESGLIFDHRSVDSLIQAVELMEKNYNFYQNNVAKIDFQQRENNMINAYLDVLSKE